MAADVVTPAILKYIDNGAFPGSEEVASAELSKSALSNVLQALRKEQEDIKQEIRSVSRDTAPDIDTWIARAKALQADIIRSRDTARRIVTEAETEKNLRAKVKDAGNKVTLLEKEVAFNETLTGTLEHIRYANGVLDGAQDEAIKGRIEQALDRLEDADSSIEGLQAMEGSRAYNLVKSRATQLKENLSEATTQCWNRLVDVDLESRKLAILDHDPTAADMKLQHAISAATRLGIFDRSLHRFCKEIDRAILKPLISLDATGMTGAVSIDGDAVKCTPRAMAFSSSNSLNQIAQLLEFLSDRLPKSLGVALSESLMPSLISRLEDSWLEASIPLDMTDMESFSQMLDSMVDLARKVDHLGWHGSRSLRDWVDRAPRSWLTKRREAVLGDVRDLVFTGIRETKEVERVETQTISKGDALASSGEGEDDEWDTAWDEPEEATSANEQVSSTHPEPASTGDEDDDASAWDIEGDDEDVKQDDDGAEEAWGWGDEDTSQKPSSPVAVKKQAAIPNEEKAEVKASSREMTLRETYYITAVPDAIVDTIKRIISDAEQLAGPAYASSPVAPAATGLYSLPTLALAIYRATAPTAYNKLPTGNMLIYNDASRLSEQLRSWQASQPPTSRLRLDNDAKLLDHFAKRAYSAEMEAQRTILRDLLDGAQGFANCTAPPFKAECESAVDQTVDRLKEVHRQWKPVLAQSALLQSLGSLLATVTGKMIVEIEEIADIAEADSQELKALCERVTTVKELFVQKSPGGDMSDMTFIYCPNWLKFQYLAEILESSLADIKYLWNEGELSLEFGAEEVVELIEALFAESDLRRRAIAEIRRGGRR